MLIKSHEQLNQAVCETFFSSQLSKMGISVEIPRLFSFLSCTQNVLLLIGCE